MDNKQVALEFGERLRSERQRLGMTQEQVADAVGVKKLTIFQYEKGNSLPSIGLVYKLQDFGFNMQYLVLADNFKFEFGNVAPSAIDTITNMVAEIERNFGGGTFTDSAKFRMQLVLLNKFLQSTTPGQLSEAEAAELVVKGHHVQN
ncbi:MAG: helix-turn-helix transcriptional regulator [Undibacterium umbellatum]|uniref:helix-turn-helix domain-containing protein n=1 Tax=Undibacterium umbellatum TaxID=2762300 RepID=UPI003BB5D7B2